MHLFHTTNVHVDLHKFPQKGKTRGIRLSIRRRNLRTGLWRHIRIKFVEFNHKNPGSRGTLTFEVATFKSRAPKVHSLREMTTYKMFFRMKVGLGGKK